MGRNRKRRASKEDRQEAIERNNQINNEEKEEKKMKLSKKKIGFGIGALLAAIAAVAAGFFLGKKKYSDQPVDDLDTGFDEDLDDDGYTEINPEDGETEMRAD